MHLGDTTMSFKYASWGLSSITFAAGMLLASSASAHINIVSPASRYGPDQIKDAPCGTVDNAPGINPPHVFEPGETITVTIDEFIAHEGHLRIAWAENDEDIVTITAFDDFDNFPGVLLDNIEDPAGAKVFSIDVTLPDVECVNCTLQVIQVMYDGDGFQENDLYYSCADITLMAGAATTTGGGDDDGGDVGSGEGTAEGDGPGGDVESGGTLDGGETQGPGGTADGTPDETADAAESGDGTSTGTGGGDDSSDDDSGCSVAPGSRRVPGWLALGLIPLFARRRR